MLTIICFYNGRGKCLQRELENLIKISFLLSELMGTWKKNNLKVNAVPTLFSSSKPKQKRECSMKRSEVVAKKQVFSMLRNSHEGNIR